MDFKTLKSLSLPLRLRWLIKLGSTRSDKCSLPSEYRNETKLKSALWITSQGNTRFGSRNYDVSCRGETFAFCSCHSPSLNSQTGHGTWARTEKRLRVQAIIHPECFASVIGQSLIIIQMSYRCWISKLTRFIFLSSPLFSHTCYSTAYSTFQIQRKAESKQEEY